MSSYLLPQACTDGDVWVDLGVNVRPQDSGDTEGLYHVDVGDMGNIPDAPENVSLF